MISKDMEKTIIQALSTDKGIVKHSWATKYNIDGMVVFDYRQPVAYLTMDEWEKLWEKYKSKFIKCNRSTYCFKKPEI